MRSVEISISTVVILIIATIVLILVLYYFYTNYSKSSVAQINISEGVENKSKSVSQEIVNLS